MDWSGNAEFSGDVIANGCGSQNSPVSLIDIGTKTNLLEIALAEIEDIISEEIQALSV